MDLLIAIIIGTLFAGGVYSILRRSLMKVLIGIILLSQAANLLVFAAGGLVRGVPAFALSTTQAPPEGYADPLPQALVLTAIVIGFGLTVFALSLLIRASEALRTDDIDQLQGTDRLS